MRDRRSSYKRNAGSAWNSLHLYKSPRMRILKCINLNVICPLCYSYLQVFWVTEGYWTKTLQNKSGSRIMSHSWLVLFLLSKVMLCCGCSGVIILRRSEAQLTEPFPNLPIFIISFLSSVNVRVCENFEDRVFKILLNYFCNSI